MKKITALLTLMFTLTAALAAADFSVSAGAGGYVGYLFTRYTLTADGEISGAPVNVNAAQEMDQFNFGGFVFADLTWVKFSMGLQRGFNNYSETMIAVIDDPGTDDIIMPSAGKGSETMWNFSLLGKYPFTFNEQITLFPMLGMEYQVALEQRRTPDRRSEYNRADGIREADVNGDPYSLSAWNSLFVVAGGGVDYRMFSSLFVRAELLFGFRLQTPYETDALAKTKKGVNAPNPKLGGLTGGPALSISAGWRFL